MAAIFIDSDEGLVRTSGLVAANSSFTWSGRVYVAALPAAGTWTTFFYRGDNPATLYTDYVWVGLSGNEDGELELNVDNTVNDFSPSPVTLGWHDVDYTYDVATHVHRVYLDGALVASVTRNITAHTFTHEYLGRDTLAGDWDPLQMYRVREWSDDLTNALINTNRLSATVVTTSGLHLDTPLTSDLLDDSGNGRDWTASGGTITFTSDPELSARLYVLNEYPGTLIRGGAKGSWARQSLFQRSWTADQVVYQLGTTKTGGGIVTNQSAKTNQQGDYDVLFWSMMTNPRGAGSVSGTLQLCCMVHARWFTGLGQTTESVVRFKVHAYIAVGSTKVVRHVLVNNQVDTSNWPTGSAQSWVRFSFDMTTGTMEAGDRVWIELGARIVSSPTPTPSYPPVAWTLIPIRGTGTTDSGGSVLADALNGDTSTSRAPWVEIATLPAAQSLPAAPANDACADAIVVDPATLPYASDHITTKGSTDTNHACWWTITPTVTGRYVVHAFGSNYPVELHGFRNGCGTLTPITVLNGLAADVVRFNNPRCLSYAVLDLTSGVQVHIRARHYATATSFNAPDKGGALRLGIFRQLEPQEDDLYLPCGYVCAIRDGHVINFNPAFFSDVPTGVAIDYTARPILDGNGGTHTGERLLVGVHQSERVEILDLPTLNLDVFEVDLIQDPWEVADVTNPVAQLHCTAEGLLFAGWFGNGYQFVLGTGGLPAILNTVSSQASYTAIKRIDATHADFQDDAPFTDVETVVTIEHTAPWAISIDEGTGWLYYTSSGFYEPVGGSTDVIRRVHIESGAEELFATITLQGTNNPGLKGLQALTGGVGVLVCNGTVAHRLDNTGAIVTTYTPSTTEDHQSCCDIKLSADGASVYVVDEDSTRITKFNFTTGAEEDTWQPWLLMATLCQMAIYQPEGFEPPEPEVDICVLERPSIERWAAGEPTLQSIEGQPTRPQSTSTWSPTYSVTDAQRIPLAEVD